LFYCTYDVASGHYRRAIEGSCILAVYLGLYWLVLLSKAFTITKRVTGVVYLVALMLAFFMHGGLRGVASLDFAATLVILITVFVDRERFVMLSLIMLQFASFVMIEVNYPHIIRNVRSDDPLILQFIGIGVRFITLTYGVYLNKNEYDKERHQVYKVNESLRLAKEENDRSSQFIEAYNNQLKQMVENLRKEKQQVTKSNLLLEDANAEIKAQGQKIQEYNHKLRKLVNDLEKEKAHAEQLNLQLKKVNEDIIKKNEIIEMANHNLERKVAERTSSIVALNKRLIEYSFHNSHRVRGPLARILGLLNLMKIFFSGGGRRSTEEIEYFTMLNKSAEELDNSIREITTFLNDMIKEEAEIS
jgi:signal transduction histidine kinase